MICAYLIFLLINGVVAQNSNSTNEEVTKEGKVIRVERMKIYSLCGSDDGKADIQISLEWEGNFEKHGIPASLSAKARVDVKTAFEVVKVEEEVVMWPKYYEGKLLPRARIKVVEKDLGWDDLLGESEYFTYESILTDGTEWKISGTGDDKECLAKGETLLNPAFDVWITAEISSSHVLASSSWLIITMLIFFMH